MAEPTFNHDSSIESDSSFLVVSSTTGSDAGGQENREEPLNRHHEAKLAACTIKPSSAPNDISDDPHGHDRDRYITLDHGKTDDRHLLQMTDLGNTDDNSQQDSTRMISDVELADLISKLTDRDWLEKEYDQSYKPIGESYRFWTYSIIEKVCNRALPIISRESNLVEVCPPIIIVGDIHGQHENLLDHFEKNKFPNEGSRYLFLGDYVDRGKRSLEVILLLLCLKIQHPDDIFLLRGNHEIESINFVYGFAAECQRRSVKTAYRKLNDLFNYMSIAALVKSKPSAKTPEEFPIMLCMHGGISPDLTSLDDIRNIRKPVKISIDSPLAIDLTWADPDRGDNAASSRFSLNSSRGISYVFGCEAVRDLMRNTKIQLIVRAHQCVQFGYEFLYDKKVVTLFSAPNYTGEFDNDAAVMQVEEDFVCRLKILSQRPRRPV